jgi:hypothetical protein
MVLRIFDQRHNEEFKDFATTTRSKCGLVTFSMNF